MGIKSNFNKFLKEKCLNNFKQISLRELSYKKVAIDISLYMYKFKAVYGNNWVFPFIQMISCMRKNDIHCVFIFDGKAPPEKDKEREKRREEREKMKNQVNLLQKALTEYKKTGFIDEILKTLYERKRSPDKTLMCLTKNSIDIKWVEDKILQKQNQIIEIVPEDYSIMKELFGLLNVPFYEAPTEAEKMCSKLCMDNLVNAVLTDDTDVIAYGAPVVLTNIDISTETCTKITVPDLYTELNLDKTQFLDHCIMCGTDYNQNIPKIGAVIAYKKIQECKNIEGVQKSGIDISILNHVRVRELFTTFEDYKITEIPFCGIPDFDKLQAFLNRNNINISIHRIINNFSKCDIVFIDEDTKNNINEIGKDTDTKNNNAFIHDNKQNINKEIDKNNKQDSNQDNSNDIVKNDNKEINK